MRNKAVIKPRTLIISDSDEIEIGQFVVAPAKAEEMYHPETFGRTGTDFVKVE